MCQILAFVEAQK